MAHGVLTPRHRGVVGLTAVAAGTAVLVASLAGPAAAHEGKEPFPIEETRNLSCAELAELLGIDADWTEFKIDVGELPPAGESQDYAITPDGTVTITTLADAKAFDWTSTVGIDAVYVKGGQAGSYFYGYQPDVDEHGDIVGDGEESFGDRDLGTPPYWGGGDNPYNETKNQISHVTFCWDDESSTSTSSTTSSSTPAPSGGSTTTTSIDLATDTPTPPSTTPTTLPADVTTSDDTLPRTGSNSTGMMVALGAVLVLAGGALLATTRIVRRRS
jgi:LPXTG-motif cell wall-anchored protein